jgi:hypothetical protein
MVQLMEKDLPNQVDPSSGQRLLTITSEWWAQPLVMIGALAEDQGNWPKGAQSWAPQPSDQCRSVLSHTPIESIYQVKANSIRITTI